VLRWVLASAPLILLLLGLMKFKLGAKKAGFLSWVAALAVAWAAFGATWEVLLFSSLKGASLTLYVAAIIWTSTFMFKMVFETGKFDLVSEYMGTLASDRLVLGLLIAWCCSGVIQGIAGYGVPVAVCAPLMIAAGFEPLTGIAAVLVGHSWSVTFGSMGSSFHALAMSTGYAPDVLGNAVGLGFILPTVVTGFCVGHIVGGVQGLKGNWLRIAAVGGSMGLIQWTAARSGLGQVAALLASLAGVVAIALIGRQRSGASREVSSESFDSLEAQAKKSTLVRILSPYATLLVVATIGQIAKRYIESPKFGFDFPATVTSQGFEVAASKAYAAINLFTHPAPLILMATLICLPILIRSGLLDRPRLAKAFKGTVGQALPTSMGILTMVMMALVMMDSGMTSEMARGVADVTGWLFPLFSPFIGVLGCFMTGSNTNSNVLFSAFQIQTAELLSISPLVVATAQTIGGSLGSAIAPAKIFLGASTAGLSGKESEVLRRAVGYCLLIVSLVGVQALVFSMIGG
jgi:lactate permease